MTFPANSIVCWADLEKQFHKYFFAGMHEMTLTDLTSLRQRSDELVTAFIQRFREVRNKCYSLTLNDAQLAELAFQGLMPHIKEKYASQEFESLTQLLHRMLNQDVRPYEQRGISRRGSHMWSTRIPKKRLKSVWLNGPGTKSR
jgi:hypothetical protein